MIHAQCTGNGLISGCACNFINACKWDASTKTFNAFSGSAKDLEKFIPNVRSFAASVSQVAEICEPGSIALIYDCRNRIPLAATIVMTADQYEDRSYARPKGVSTFKKSLQIRDDLQQNDDDYTMPLERIPCYETLNGDYYIEESWFNALNPTSWASYHQKCAGTLKKSAVHRGHMIASSYGRGTPYRAIQTFIYTNAIPQFGKINSGSWRSFEGKLISWARNNCNKAPLYITVGSIPSTYHGNQARFFGEAGFSDFMGPSSLFSRKERYRVNVPAFMWTAACCHSISPSPFTKSTAFYAPNKPGHKLVKGVELSSLFLAVRVRPNIADDIDLFPGMPGCTSDSNYIPI